MESKGIPPSYRDYRSLHPAGEGVWPQVPPTSGNLGTHKITPIAPPARPKSMSVDFAQSLWQRLFPLVEETSEQLRASQAVLGLMGARSGQIALAQNVLSKDTPTLKSLCDLFTGDGAPVRMGREDETGLVMFELPSKFDTEKLADIAHMLERCALPAQAASLLMSLTLALESGIRNHAPLRTKLAEMLKRHPDVKLPDRALQLHAIATSLAGTDLEQCKFILSCCASSLEPVALKTAIASRRAWIEGGMQKVLEKHQKTTKRAEALAPVVSDLSSLLVAALDAGAQDALNFAVNTLETLRDAYFAEGAKEALDHGMTHIAKAQALGDESEAFDALHKVEAKIGSQLLRFGVDHQGSGKLVNEEDKNKKVNPEDLLTYLKATTKLRHWLSPSAMANHIEHGQRQEQHPFTPAVVRDLCLQYAQSNPQHASEAIQAWAATLKERKGGNELSPAEIEAAVSICAKHGKLALGSLKAAMQAIMLLPSCSKDLLPPAAQTELLHCLLQLDGKELKQLAPTFALKFLADPGAHGPDRLELMLEALVEAKKGASFDEILKRVESLYGKVGQEHLRAPLASALLACLLECVPSHEEVDKWDQKLEALAGSLDCLAVSGPSDDVIYENMMEIFVPLFNATPLTEALMRLDRALISRTNIRKLVLQGPRERHASYRLMAAFLAAAVCTGMQLAKVSSHSEILVVYILLCLRGFAERRGHPQAAKAYLDQAIDLFMNHESDVRPWRMAAASGNSGAKRLVLRAIDNYETSSQDCIFDPDLLLVLELRKHLTSEDTRFHLLEGWLMSQEDDSSEED